MLFPDSGMGQKQKLDRRRGLKMRDMDLIRKLLLNLEPVDFRLGNFAIVSPEIEGYNPNQIDHHLDLMCDAGFLNGKESVKLATGFAFCGLTWEGYELLDSIRDDEVWRKTKGGLQSAGGFTIDLLKDLAKGFLKKQVEEKTGITL
jgi:hypothetical protein